MRAELAARMGTDRFSNSTTSFRNKALDAAEHPDLVVRARERQDLDWWVRQARWTLDAGLL
jgi:hypothetical protein